MDEFDWGTMIIERYPPNILQPKHLSESYMNAHCFLRYAAQEWCQHLLETDQTLITDFVRKRDDLNKLPTLRDTWLHRAAESGHEGVVLLLLKNGADIAARDNKGGTVLHGAVSNDREAVVRLLL